MNDDGPVFACRCTKLACRRGCVHISINITDEGTCQDMPHCEVTYGPVRGFPVMPQDAR